MKKQIFVLFSILIFTPLKSSKALMTKEEKELHRIKTQISECIIQIFSPKKTIKKSACAKLKMAGKLINERRKSSKLILNKTSLAVREPNELVHQAIEQIIEEGIEEANKISD